MDLITIYHYDNITGEYLYETQPYKGSELPEYATEHKPPKVKKKQVSVFDGESWQVHPDHRGEMHYDTSNGAPVLINHIGELPKHLTTMVPNQIDDIWIDGAWHPNPDIQPIQKNIETDE